MTELQQKLRDFFLGMTVDDDKITHHSGEWWIGIRVPSWDFNREIACPGHKDYPDGAIGIRVDGDFWLVALLPYEYEPLTIQQIFEVIWADEVDEPTFAPDTFA